MSDPQVVKVFATTQNPDYDTPWQARPPRNGTGSGVVVGPNEVLTGAHVVSNATFIQVQKVADPNKAIARVKAVCHDCDLALLELVEEDDFLDGIVPVEIGDLPDLRDKVSVVGFPVGGEQVSITEGVVSRVEVQRYSHSQRRLLAVTVDAAINEGNSGGPVLRDGKVVGIAFQTVSNTENIGEIVPAPIIDKFLSGVPLGKHASVPGLGLRTQNLENKAQRRSAGLAKDDAGVLVIGVELDGSCDGVSKPGDVLVEIAGHPIANNGTITYRGKFRTRFDVLLLEYFVGDEIELVVRRDGQRQTLRVELAPLTHLVPRYVHDRQPTFFVYGGIVFQTLTRDFLTTWDDWWHRAPKEFLNDYYAGSRSEARSEVIMLTQILADELNLGYAGLYNEGIVNVNGIKPRDMVDFVTRVEASDRFVEIETSTNGVIVFDPAEVKRGKSRIMERYHITRDRSVDLPGS